MKDIVKALRYLSSGVVLVAVSDGAGKFNAFTAAWVMQVSFDPVLLAISINPEHRSYAMFKKLKYCTINILDKSQMEYAAHYGQSTQVDKMSLGTWDSSQNKVAILKEALVSFECKWESEMPAGDHQLVVCKVVASEILHTGSPMLYSDTENMDGSAELVKEIKS